MKAAKSKTVGTFSVSPKWTSGSPPKDKKQIGKNGNGTLTCDVKADPPPSFSWYFDGKRILSST